MSKTPTRGSKRIAGQSESGSGRNSPEAPVGSDANRTAPPSSTSASRTAPPSSTAASRTAPPSSTAASRTAPPSSTAASFAPPAAVRTMPMPLGSNNNDDDEGLHTHAPPPRRAASDVARDIMAAEEWSNTTLRPGDIERTLVALQRDLDPMDPARLFLSSRGVLGAISRRFQPTIGGMLNMRSGRPSPTVLDVVTHILEQVDVVIEAATRVVPPSGLMHDLSLEDRVAVAAAIFVARGTLLRGNTDEEAAENASDSSAWRSSAAKSLVSYPWMRHLSLPARKDKVRALLTSLIGDAPERMRESRMRGRRQEADIDEIFDKCETADRERSELYEVIEALNQRVAELEDQSSRIHQLESLTHDLKTKLENHFLFLQMRRARKRTRGQDNEEDEESEASESDEN